MDVCSYYRIIRIGAFEGTTILDPYASSISPWKHEQYDENRRTIVSQYRRSETSFHIGQAQRENMDNDISNAL